MRRLRSVWAVLIVTNAIVGLSPVSRAEDSQYVAVEAVVRQDAAEEHLKPVAVNHERADPDTRKLLESMLETARANPASGEARGQLGMAYEINGYGAAALVSFTQAETLDPTNFLWPYMRALLLGCHVMSSPSCAAARVDYAAALQSIDRALAIDDAYVPAWLWRATWLAELDRLDEAADAYRRALELGGEDAAASVGLARILLRQGRPGKTVALLEPLTDAYSYTAIYRVLGRGYQALGRSEETRIAFARGKDDRLLVWLDPRQAMRDQYVVSYGGRLVRAEKALNAGHYAVALEELEALRSARPDDPTVLRHIGTAYLRVGQRARARDVLRLGLELDPHDYHLNLFMAGLYREAGLTDRALEYMQRAIDAVPIRGRAHYLLATILMDQGRLDDARVAIGTALQYGVNNPEQVLYTAGMLEVTQQDWDAAAARFEQAVSLDAAFAGGYLALARTRAEQGRFDEARAALVWAEKLTASPEELAAARWHVKDLETTAGAAR